MAAADSTPAAAMDPDRAGAEVPRRIAVLVSGGGTNLQAVLDAAAQPGYGARVVLVASDRPDAGGVGRAHTAGIPTAVVRPADHPDRAAFDAALRDVVAAMAPDVVCLAGFMRILGPAFLAAFPDRVVNTHPSLLPAFPGATAVRDALAYGVHLTGCTVHLVDEQVDHGPVLAQAGVPVLDGDDVSRLHERIKQAEHRLVPAVVRAVAFGQVERRGRWARIRTGATSVGPARPGAVRGGSADQRLAAERRSG